MLQLKRNGVHMHICANAYTYIQCMLDIPVGDLFHFSSMIMERDLVV